MDRAGFLYDGFLRRFPYEPTSCQDSLMRDIAAFLTEDDGDILVVNGYAGTGKTTVVGAVISLMGDLKTPCVLLAPTGRAAKVLSAYTGRPAFTVHKHIYRQKSHGDDGMGLFSLAPNKAKNTLFIVDEVSLIGIDEGTRSSTATFGSGNLLEDLILFLRNGTDCRMILIGDAAQLPPIGLDCSPAHASTWREPAGFVFPNCGPSSGSRPVRGSWPMPRGSGNWWRRMSKFRWMNWDFPLRAMMTSDVFRAGN